MNYLNRLFFLPFLILLLFACNKPEPLPHNVGPLVLKHTVKYQGETLSIIASWYTGNGGMWKVIAQSNSDLNPGKLRIGQVIKIPWSLIKRNDEFPEKYVTQFYRRTPLPPKEEAAAPAKTPNPEATIDSAAPSDNKDTDNTNIEATPTPAVIQSSDPQTNQIREQTREELLKEIGAE
jgi:hypothetical protein